MCNQVYMKIPTRNRTLPSGVIPKKLGEDLYLFIEEPHKEPVFTGGDEGVLVYFTPDPKGIGCSCDVLNDGTCFYDGIDGDGYLGFSPEYNDVLKEFLKKLTEDLNYVVHLLVMWDGVKAIKTVTLEEYYQLMDSERVVEDVEYRIVGERTDL